MPKIITISDKGYSTDEVTDMASDSDVCLHDTMLIVAVHNQNQQVRSQLYYIDGSTAVNLDSTSRIIAKLEAKTGYARDEQIEACYRLLPAEFRGQMRSWVMQNHGFVPVTSYKAGPTTWINVRHIKDVQTRGKQTCVILLDGTIIKFAKYRDKFIKQLIATKVVSLWLTQYVYGHGERSEKNVLPWLSWPKNVSYCLNKEHYKYMLIAVMLEKTGIRSLESTVVRLSQYYMNKCD